jgi:hypothetical protein
MPLLEEERQHHILVHLSKENFHTLGLALTNSSKSLGYAFVNVEDTLAGSHCVRQADFLKYFINWL